MKTPTASGSHTTHAARRVLLTAAVAALAVTASASVTHAATSLDASAAPTTAASAHTATAPVGTVQRTNDVDFVQLTQKINVSFAYTHNYSVTSGQPWGGVTATPTTQSPQVTVKALAGRHNSTPPAQFFTSHLQSPNPSNPDAIAAQSQQDELPSDLNFAFTGNLTINGTSYPVVLGQGHQWWVGYNNWWVGGAPVTPGQGTWTQTTYQRTWRSGVYPALVTPDKKYEIIPDVMTNDYSFYVLAYTAPK